MVLAALALQACPADAETFGEVLGRMAQGHPRIVAAQQLSRGGRADVSAARSAYRPQVGVETNAGWQTVGGNSGFTVLPEAKVSQLVFDGGRTPAEIRRRKLRVDLLGVQEQSVLADISFQLAQAWIDYARASDLAFVSWQQVSALQTLDKLVVEIAQYDRGRASDVVMVESRLQQAVTTQQTREISLAEARARIREISALPVEPTGGIPDIAAFLPRNAEDAQGLVPVSPAVRIADLEVAENAETVRGTKNWWMPSLALEGARTSDISSQGDTRLFNAFAFRLNASMVPFDSGGGRSRHESARATLESARSNAELTRVSLGEQARRLWIFQAQRTERLPSMENLVDRADQAREVVFEQFRIGRRSILDLLSYDLERFNVRAQLVNERYDIAQTQYQLMGVLGRIYPAVVEGDDGRRLPPGTQGPQP
ncbi:TolC family protein [Novosphingobium resinovorum]|uniref:Uncharacterized protein n=1 Tax=Novosphingobium resinovorum TaxID=158500 RepID=A0A1D8AFQ6_9SPHN|nr:TolC family protein [Novosphingobium resinovorum]AOR80891.1 hypothetical protein BES08_29310 [Novosphingobium resinovorum]